MTDRFIAGVLTSIALCLTVIVLTFFLSIYRGGISESIALWSSVPMLLLFLGVTGFLIGVFLGAERAFTLLSLFWMTAEPRRPLFSVSIWFVVIVLWFVAYKITLHVQP